MATDNRPRLHQSIASILVNRSPLHAWYKAFRAEPEEFDDASNSGTLCHALLLGGKSIVAVEADDWRTKAAREQREFLRAEGKIPCLSRKLAIAHTLADKVLKQLGEVYGIRLIGESEKYVEWQVANGAGTMTDCAGTIDHWLPKHRTILDFKSTAAVASPDGCARLMINAGSDIQQSAYRQAIEHLHPEIAGRLDFLFVYFEMDAPHAVTVVRPGGMMRQLGDSKWGRAIELWNRYLHEYGPENPWPAYSSEIVEVQPPAWAMAQNLAESEILERAESNAC